MNSEVMEDVISFVFTTLLPYLLPVLFLFMVILFSERLIDMMVNAVSARTRKRR